MTEKINLKSTIGRLYGNHLLMSGIFKGLSGISLFLSIPCLLNYLGDHDYGIWVLVFTIFQWILVMDFGLQSSLKTNIPALIKQHNEGYVISYIKKIYLLSSYVAAAIFIVFSLLVLIIDTRSFLNIETHSARFTETLFIINIFFFCVNSVAGIHKSLYVAFLKGKYSEESLAVNQVLFLATITIISFLLPDISSMAKLIVISLANGLVCLGVNLVYTRRFFKFERLRYSSSHTISRKDTGNILKMGYKFMIIQLGMMLFFTVDNYIISNHFSPKDVVPYDSVTKIFLLPTMILYAVLAPLWSVFAKDISEGNRANIQKIFRRFNYAFIAIMIATGILAAITPFLISIWLRQSIEIPANLILFIALVTLMRIFTTFYSYFVNATGKLNLYMAIIIVSIILKIPLTNMLVGMDYGINSVIIATGIIMTGWMILIPMQSYRELKRLNFSKP